MGYQVLSQVSRVLLSSRTRRSRPRFSDVIRRLPGHIEGGTDGLRAEEIRPLVYWEWPDTLVALWPPGPRMESSGPRVVDTGSLAGYFSLPESEMALPLELAGPDYVRVPEALVGSVELAGRQYRHLNRWVSVI